MYIPNVSIIIYLYSVHNIRLVLQHVEPLFSQCGKTLEDGQR